MSRNTIWLGIFVAVATLGCGNRAEPEPEPRTGVSREELSLETKLTKPAVDVGEFGFALALSQNRLIVGDPGHGASPNYQRGGAWVFELGAGGWTLHGEPKPADGPGSQNHFGSKVAIDGDRVVVTEPGDAQIYVFGFTSGQWLQESAILQTPFQPHSVAISGDTFVIGAPDEWNGTSYSGRAHVYRKSGGTWALEATLVPADPGEGGVGTAVALDGDTLLLGGPPGGGNDGAAYVFTRSGTTWTEQATLTPGIAFGSGLFGSAVALDGDTAVVGAHIVGASGGNAWVFVRSGTTWTKQAELSTPSGGTNEYFGYAVSVHQDLLAVGAPHADAAGMNSGAVYVFARSGATWAPLSTIVPQDGVQNDWFGNSVGLVGDRVASGAPFHVAGPTTGTGAAYVYDLTSPNGTTCANGSDCGSGYCVDGVCCDTECGGGVADCTACSISSGASSDGVCAPVAAGTSCDDGDACTENDQCQSGVCTPGPDNCGGGGTAGSSGSGGSGGVSVGGASGTGGAPGGAAGAGALGGTASAGAGGGANASGSDSGCGCRVAGDSPRNNGRWSALIAWLLTALALGVRSRTARFSRAGTA